MATVGTTYTLIRTLLGTSADDPQFTDTILLPIVQSAYDSLLTDLAAQNPDYLSTAVTLTADSASSHTYTFASQASPITNFARWISVRETDDTGAPLAEARRDELRSFGSGYFQLRGPDDAPILVTSPDTTAGIALYFEYAYWPVALAASGDSLTGLPARFHDVVAFEALFAYGLGGEQRRPPELSARWVDRRAQLLSSVGRRGIQPSQSRLVTGDF